MHLHHLLLPCLDPGLTLRFYRYVLALPVHGNAVRIGWSTLECVQAQRPVGSVLWPSTWHRRACRRLRSGSAHAPLC